MTIKEKQNMSVNLKLSNKILKSIKDTLESSTIHAIPSIVRNRFYLIKIIWFLCLIVSSGFCGWFIQKSLTDYFSYDVVSKTDIVYVNKIIFPIVSICNLNLFSTPNGSEHVLTLSRSIFGSTDFTTLNFGYPAALITNAVKNVGNYSFDREKFGPNLNEILIRCKFNSQDCNLTQDFEYFYDVNYGNCFRFNSGRNMIGQQVPLKYVSRTGLTNSLELELFIGKASENNNLFSQENGYIIFINNETLDSTAFEGIQISPGFSTRITLDKFSLTKVANPYSECTDDLTSINSYKSDTYKKTFSSNKTYHYSDCVVTCYLKYIAKNCGCLSGYYNIKYDNKIESCLSNNILVNLDCEFVNSNKFFKDSDQIEDCDCPIECQKSGYNYVTSFAEYPTREYAKYLKQNDLIKSKLLLNKSDSIGYQDLRESIAKVVIFYDELKETRITQNIKVQLLDLIANIGGILGLFLGLCLCG